MPALNRKRSVSLVRSSQEGILCNSRAMAAAMVALTDTDIENKLTNRSVRGFQPDDTELAPKNVILNEKQKKIISSNGCLKT